MRVRVLPMRVAERLVVSRSLRTVRMTKPSFARQVLGRRSFHLRSRPSR